MAVSNFDPDRAVRQQFIDSIVGACATRSEDGYGFGWHFVGLEEQLGQTIATFETGYQLRGYRDGRALVGPHRVRVSITTVGAGEYVPG